MHKITIKRYQLIKKSLDKAIFAMWLLVIIGTLIASLFTYQIVVVEKVGQESDIFAVGLFNRFGYEAGLLILDIVILFGSLFYVLANKLFATRFLKYWRSFMPENYALLMVIIISFLILTALTSIAVIHICDGLGDMIYYIQYHMVYGGY